ncbi:MAG: hypothetical protein NWR97_00990 [Salibacteraceae bacterium]|nr:hypothetical protein [Salibacteraceae bacterium]
MLNSFYSFGIRLFGFSSYVASMFQPKAAAWLEGRTSWRNAFEGFSKVNKLVWIHCASVGEFEQARPIIEKLKAGQPCQVVVTFFSPSGYEVRKNYPLADVVCYLPLDLRSNARSFFDVVKPDVALFIKYDFWFNFMQILNERKIPSAVVSAYLPNNHWLLHFPGSLLVKRLAQFDKLFLQDDQTKLNLEKFEIPNLEVVGDTRVDRVLENKEQDFSSDIIQSFSESHQVVVVGSNWPEDDELLFSTIKESRDLKWIVAPHQIEDKQLSKWRSTLGKDVLFWSEIQDSSYTPELGRKVLLIDSIGLLSKLYRFADLAYVGGGFGAAVHNTLEAAVYHIPVLFGPNNQRFLEIQDLKRLEVGFEITSEHELKQTLKKALSDTDLRNRASHHAESYFSIQKGASVKVLDWVNTVLAN